LKPWKKLRLADAALGFSGWFQVRVRQP